MIDVDELRVVLRINGVDETTYSDDELNNLINFHTGLFNTLICFNYNLTEYEEYYPVSESTRSLLINHYPIQSLSTLKIGDKDYTSNIKYLDKKPGIIYFKEPLTDDVSITYMSGFDETQVNELIKPLILDLIVYGVKYGVGGVISSLSEGDVSVSYDTSMSIQSRINDLNKRYCVKARMI